MQTGAYDRTALPSGIQAKKKGHCGYRITRNGAVLEVKLRITAQKSTMGRESSWYPLKHENPEVAHSYTSFTQGNYFRNSVYTMKAQDMVKGCLRATISFQILTNPLFSVVFSIFRIFTFLGIPSKSNTSI